MGSPPGVTTLSPCGTFAVVVHPPHPVSAGRLAEYKRLEETPRGGLVGEAT